MHCRLISTSVSSVLTYKQYFLVFNYSWTLQFVSFLWVTLNNSTNYCNIKNEFFFCMYGLHWQTPSLEWPGKGRTCKSDKCKCDRSGVRTGRCSRWSGLWTESTPPTTYGSWAPSPTPQSSERPGTAPLTQRWTLNTSAMCGEQWAHQVRD